MRTERFRRGLGSILIVSALLISMTLLMTFTATPVLTKLPIVIDEPGGDTITVYQGATFTIQFKLQFNEPGYGYFSLGIYWDSPKTGSAGTPSENFTFVSASAYLEDNLDNIPIELKFSEGVPYWENENMWRHVIDVYNLGYPWDDNFYVDIVLRASGAGGVPHVPTNNHPIVISGTIDVADPTIFSYTPPDPYITIKVLGRGVAVSISPSENSGPPGATLNYSVTVTNTGVEDNYDLTISENEDWGPTLDNYLFENVQPGESRITTLSITVPENAVPYAEDYITVTATSQVDNQVKDNDSCIARVVPWTGTAVFRGLENLYAVRLEKNLDLYWGSKLVVKFYTYWDAFENESVIENFVPPVHVEENENARHPGGTGVKKARLDLTTDNTENVISTIASFVVNRSRLITRISQIKSLWPFAPPAERSALIAEISGIKAQWPFAPS